MLIFERKRVKNLVRERNSIPLEGGPEMTDDGRWWMVDG
jgi:hypothetical protein